MSNRFQGNVGRGASRKLRALKRAEAEERNTRTLPERKRSFRRTATQKGSQA